MPATHCPCSGAVPASLAFPCVPASLPSLNPSCLGKSGDRLALSLSRGTRGHAADGPLGVGTPTFITASRGCLGSLCVAPLPLRLSATPASLLHEHLLLSLCPHCSSGLQLPGDSMDLVLWPSHAFLSLCLTLQWTCTPVVYAVTVRAHRPGTLGSPILSCG